MYAKSAQALLTLLNQTSADQGMWQYRSMYVVVIVDSSRVVVDMLVLSPTSYT